MDKETLKELLAQLNDILESTDHVDDETLGLVRELDEEIHRLTSEEAPSEEFEGVLDQAKSMEARFAVEHPVADRVLREIIDALARVGI